MGPEDSPFAESASIALSFLRSASPSYEVLPKPDIDSSMLRAADALLFQAAEDDAVSETRRELNASLHNTEDSAAQAEDARLVAKFLSAVLEEPSSSDGAPAPPASLSVTAHEKVRGTTPRGPSSREAADQTPRRPSLPNQVPPRAWSPLVGIPSVFDVTGAIAQGLLDSACW